MSEKNINLKKIKDHTFSPSYYTFFSFLSSIQISLYF